MSHTKDRMIEAAAESIRRRGIAATSFTEVLEQAAAPRGVIYHHFPGGKEELTQAAVAWTGRSVSGHLAAFEPAEPTAVGVIRAFLDLVRPIVGESAAGAGCAVAAAATEAAAGTPAALAAQDALRLWRSELARQLTAVGVKPAQARAIASLLLATLEGAHVLCRAEGSIEPFDAAAQALLGLAAP